MRPHKNTKELLLRVAVDLFSQKGYLDTSIRDIATKTGIASSIIYHYFKDKEEMLFEIIRSTTEDLIKSLREAEERIKDPEECLREMLRAHIVNFNIKRKKESIIVASDTHLLRDNNAVKTLMLNKGTTKHKNRHPIPSLLRQRVGCGVILGREQCSTSQSMLSCLIMAMTSSS